MAEGKGTSWPFSVKYKEKVDSDIEARKLESHSSRRQKEDSFITFYFAQGKEVGEK